MSYDKFDSYHNEEGNRREGASSSNYKSENRGARPRFVKNRPSFGGNSYGKEDRDNYAYGNREGNTSYRSSYRNEGGYSGHTRSYDRPYDRNDFGKRSENRFNKRPASAGRFGGSHEEGGYNRGEGGFNRSYDRRENFGTRDRSFGTRPYGERNFGDRSFGERRERPEGFTPRRSFGEQGGFKENRPQRPGYNPHAKYSMKKRLEYKEKHYDPNEPVRLNKFLSNAGVCSRRDADKFIASGVVKVNGEVVTELGTKVLRSDTVHFHDQAIKMEKKVYILLNKPKGYVTTSEDPQNRKTVMDLVQGACPERIYPVGRLDRGTTGVLLFTNDGELASSLTHPRFLKKKIYHVYTDRNVTAADLRQITEGITLEDGEIKADAAEYASETDKKQVGIEIHSGKNRIVRRIFEHLGYQVVKLDRVYFAGLTKKNLRRGDWRFLTEKEVEILKMGAYE